MQHVTKLFFLNLFLPILILNIVGKNPKKYGLRLGKKRLTILFIILFVSISIPLMFWSSRRVEFREYYPIWSSARLNLSKFVIYGVLIGLIMLSTEFFYRGYILFQFRKLGMFSILIQTIPYVCIHLGKPLLEVYASLPAGILFGYMAWKTKSIVPSFISHWLIAIIFDILVMV